MVNNFKFTGISHKQADIKLRELVALDENASKKLLFELKEKLGLQEALILSTCNRTEVYYNDRRDLSFDIARLIGVIKGLENPCRIAAKFEGISENSAAVQYLFHIAMGLESKVVGDIQISNQVKKAYQWSCDEGMAGPLLHRLMHTVFFCNKRVSQETCFRDGAASVSYAATEIAENLTSQILDPKILVLGLGEIGEDVVRNLVDREFREIYIANRTSSKATKLASELNLNTLPFEEAQAFIREEADVIISSVAMDQPFITADFVKDINIKGYKHFIDLSVPRSIELDVEFVPGATLHNIDNITATTNKALEKRLKAVPQVESIIQECQSEFMNWSKEMVVSPTIKKMKNSLEQIRQQEMARFLKNATEQEAKMMDKVTKGMIQKIMKLPVLQLKAACKRDEADQLVDVLNDLFDLEKSQEYVKK
ncbi:MULTISPECIES: glutamyl-tRNA reductase [Persicobacter]|uniref:Glutamyl-tRNA reductase n=1 Tax=Persicobacter diffluens TaxID=981 RepID=A0AAN5AJL2_9BACT|nr:glutamyl-tRNA reductase [Persicobacter sp. CCB-QB2]GJM59576.1 glutamyl-tRNA reductase [Persicobacter diffluens]